MDLCPLPTLRLQLTPIQITWAVCCPLLTHGNSTFSSHSTRICTRRNQPPCSQRQGSTFLCTRKMASIHMNSAPSSYLVDLFWTLMFIGSPFTLVTISAIL